MANTAFALFSIPQSFYPLDAYLTLYFVEFYCFVIFSYLSTLFVYDLYENIPFNTVDY